jgi:rod shape-determining protein MreB
MGDRLYLGIDLGTFQSSIAASNGQGETVETIVGKPKDPIARNFLKRDTLFGADALKNKLACNLYRPLAAGVAQDDENNLAAAKAFVTHLVESVDPEEFDEVYGVICSPSHISFVDKSNLVSILRGQVNAIMVVSEPFAVAFGLEEIGGSIVVDIGAGTVDVARVYGTFPNEDDETSLETAGDWIDEELKSMVEKKYTGAQLTKDMVRQWKEAGSYIGDDREMIVELSVDGKKQVVDVGDLVGIACTNLVPHVVNAIKGIIAGADPEYQPIMRNNIILSGGGSLIEGLADAVAEGLADIGDVSVWCAEDPITKVATGALALAEAMPDDQYTSIN